MKKFLFLLLLLPALAWTQDYDFYLDPIETTPVPPSARSLATGNWGYYTLQVDKLFDQIYDRTERPVAVFIFDTGGAYDHPGLKGANWNDKGRTFTQDGAQDVNGHSTHVASTYAGTGAAGEPVGICAPLLRKNHIRLIPIKVLSNSGGGSFFTIDRALSEWVNPQAKDLISKGWFVIYNFSLGGGTSVITATEKLLEQAEALGVGIVGAAGNSGGPGVIFPAVGKSTRAIAALTQAGTKASFSTTGPEVDYALPGQSIYGCWPPNLYREASGTSMATPHAGAVLATLAAVYPDATAAELFAHMAKHARDVGEPGKDTWYGWGAQDLAKMLANAPDGTLPDDPEDPEEPGDEDPIVYPSRAVPVTLRQEYRVPYSVGGNPARYVLTFRITSVEVTTTKAAPVAAQELARLTGEHFRNRGYLLPEKTDSYQAAFWAAFFYVMDMRNKGVRVQVKEILIPGLDYDLTRTNFATPNRVTRTRAKRAGASTVTAALFAEPGL